ncbi:MAG: hypothetical protein PHI59_05830 [Candidatus Omnitrophica bacterium]|nr:hypothetical protein [Candidatus Omnitrophota bacterium]
MKRIICLLIGLAFVFSGLGEKASYAETYEISNYLKTLELGSPFDYRNLTIIPIYGPGVKNRINCVTLDEAVARGYLTVTELNGGSVPEVRISNNSDYHILLVCGEILTGCRQDRLVARDTLIGPKSKGIILPVYCCEHGRWTAKSSTFASEETQAEPVLRGMLYEKREQSRVWDRISEYSKNLCVESPTGALQDVYNNKEAKSKMDVYVEKLSNIPRLDRDAVGVVVGVNGRIIGVDIFSAPDVFAHLWPKLLKSYAALAIAEEYSRDTLTQNDARRLFGEIYRADFSRQPGLDLGTEFQAYVSQMICNGLVYRDNVVHFGAFPKGDGFRDNPGRGGRVPIIDPIE